MIAKAAVAALAMLLVQPAYAAKFPLPVTPFGGISLACVIKQTAQQASYLSLVNPTAGIIRSGTQIVVKTDHGPGVTVTLAADLAPGGQWQQNNVPITGKRCTARTATLVMQLPLPSY